MIETPTKDPNATFIKTRRTQAPEYEIIKYISQFMPVSEAQAEAIVKNMKFRSFKKGTVLLKEGQVLKMCYFVLKGCIRQYFLVDGEEKTTNFFTEGQPVTATAYEGTFKQKPSKFYLACIEDTMVSLSSPEDELAFFEKFPNLKPARLLATEEELGKSQDSLSSYILGSPEEHYLNLLKTRPELLDRVPQYQLASYLGVTPESLSRIRKRIMIK